MLKKVEFRVTEADASDIFDAFKKPFPSLTHIEFATVLHAIEEYDGALEELQDQINSGSVGGEWPASIEIEHLPHSIFETGNDIKVIVRPHCGDRTFNLYPNRRWKSGELMVECDYTSRPSSFAAQDIIDIALSDKYHVINCYPHRIDLKKLLLMPRPWAITGRKESYA